MSVSERLNNSFPTLQLLIEFPLFLKIVNGGVAGIAGVTAVFPLELIRMKCINQQIHSNGQRTYSFMFHCLKKTCANEGYLSLYKGSFRKIVFTAPEVGFKLTANEFCRYRINRGHASEPLSLGSEIMAGARAGLYQFMFSSPLEQLTSGIINTWKSASQMNLEGKLMTNVHAVSLVMKFLVESNFRSCYQGKSIDLLTSICFSSIYFPIFNHLNSFGPKKRKCHVEAVFWCSFLSGCTAGSLACFFTHPIDVINCRLKAIQSPGIKIGYRKIGQICVEMLKHEGPKVLFRNVSCKMIIVGLLFGVGHMFYYIGVGEFYVGYKKDEVYKSSHLSFEKIR